LVRFARSLISISPAFRAPFVCLVYFVVAVPCPRRTPPPLPPRIPEPLADTKKIVDLQLTLLRARLADPHIALDLTDAVKEHIAREGYDPVYGARPLKRFLQRALESPLSRRLISGEITDHTCVTVEFKKGELLFEAKAGNK